MKRVILAVGLALGVSAVQAEWYVVTKVPAYNQIEAKLSEGAGSKSGMLIRVRNLEKIEYIENKRSKVMLAGAEPRKILEEMMLGQIVWVEGLETVNGENVAYVYPSYEQVLKVFTKRHMSGQYTISPAIRQKLASVHKKMLSELRSGTPERDDGGKSKDKDKSSSRSYENSYSKALFVYDGLDWFKKTGQFLPPAVQAMYVEWLADYLGASGNDARNLEIKIRDIKKHHSLYRDFLLEE